jgi:hypothetical protein
METIVNETFLAKRAKYARWGTLLGLGALFGGLLTAGQQQLLVSYGLLLVGLLAASVGSYMANRYVREPRADQRIAQALESLDKRYVLYSYYLPSEQVLFSHRGFIVLEIRNQEGLVAYEDGRWTHKAGWRKIMTLFGETSLGKPEQDLEREVGWVREWVDTFDPDQEIPVSGVILFTNPKVTLDIQGLDVPYATLAELADVIKTSFSGRPPLSTSRRREIRSMLDDMVARA